MYIIKIKAKFSKRLEPGLNLFSYPVSSPSLKQITQQECCDGITKKEIYLPLQQFFGRNDQPPGLRLQSKSTVLFLSMISKINLNNKLLYQLHQVSGAGIYLNVANRFH